jgi:hypothetical protein
VSALAAAVLAETRARFAQYRALAERALAQVDDAAFFAALGDGGPEGENSLAVVVKHLAGNFRSRWTAFLSSDGDKPDRRRDGEFVIEEGDTRAALMARWDDGWRLLDETLGGLTEGDLLRPVTIRGEPHSVLAALSRALAHTAYHAGQIVLLAKHHAGPDWHTLSIPRGQSEAYGAAHRARHQP